MAAFAMSAYISIHTQTNITLLLYLADTHIRTWLRTLRLTHTDINTLAYIQLYTMKAINAQMREWQQAITTKNSKCKQITRIYFLVVSFTLDWLSWWRWFYGTFASNECGRLIRHMLCGVASLWEIKCNKFYNIRAHTNSSATFTVTVTMLGFI